MSKQAHDRLQKALKRLRDTQCWVLGWRVIGVSEGVAFDSDEDFFYLQGQREARYPVPAVL